MDKIAIIILARKGSKRIPGKNFKLFNGKPLIHWTLECAEKLDYPVYFYSDSEEMRQYVKQFNVIIREKPDRFAQDEHKTGEEIKEYNKEIKADIIVNLQVTSPIRDHNLIRKWIDEFSHSKFNCGMSVYRLPLKFFYACGKPLNFNHEDRDYNSKPKMPLHTENGSFYIFRKEMLNCKHFIQPPIQMFPDVTGIELDYPWQWAAAELMQRKINENKSNT